MRADDVYAILNKRIKNIQTSGGGVSDYNDLKNKPEALPNPFPITFRGIAPEITYDGSEAVTVELPDLEMLSKKLGTPVGEIISYMGMTAPEHYLICDGMEYNMGDYPELAQHFVDNFGTANYFGGNGETTFAVPDLRGEFLRGSGTAVRDTGSGADVGVHQAPTEFAGMWLYKDMNFNGLVEYFNDDVGDRNNLTNFDLEGPQSKYSRSYKSDGNSLELNSTNLVSRTARPTNTSVLYCIKCELA